MHNKHGTVTCSYVGHDSRTIWKHTHALAHYLMGDATHSYLGHDPHDPSEKTHMHRHIIDVGPWRGTVTWDRDVLIRETWLTHHVRKHTHTSAQHLMGDKTPLYLGHNFLISGTWFLYIWDINCITLLKIHTCVGTELMWDVTCWYVGHHAHTIWEHTHVVGQYWIGTWLIYTWDVTHMTHRKVHVCQHAIVCGMEPVGFDWFIYHMNAWCGITQKSPCPLWTRVSACNCMRDGTCGITQKSRCPLWTSQIPHVTTRILFCGDLWGGYD